MPDQGRLLAVEGQELSWVETALVRKHLLSPAQRTVLSCLAAGMDDYLSKPLDKNALLAIIEKVSAAVGSS